MSSILATFVLVYPVLTWTSTGLGSSREGHWRLSCSPQKSQHVLGSVAWEGELLLHSRISSLGLAHFLMFIQLLFFLDCGLPKKKNNNNNIITFHLNFLFTYLWVYPFWWIVHAIVDDKWVWEFYSIIYGSSSVMFTVQPLIGWEWSTCKGSSVNNWQSKHILFRCCKICRICKRTRRLIQCVSAERKLFCFSWIAYRARPNSGGRRFAIFIAHFMIVASIYWSTFLFFFILFLLVWGGCSNLNHTMKLMTPSWGGWCGGNTERYPSKEK